MVVEDVAVALAADGALVESHDVLRARGENVIKTVLFQRSLLMGHMTNVKIGNYFLILWTFLSTNVR